MNGVDHNVIKILSTGQGKELVSQFDVGVYK